MKITVENNSQQVQDVLNQLINRVSDPEPLLQVIGKELVDLPWHTSNQA